jgi:hypothetical protein
MGCLVGGSGIGFGFANDPGSGYAIHPGKNLPAKQFAGYLNHIRTGVKAMGKESHK